MTVSRTPPTGERRGDGSTVRGLGWPGPSADGTARATPIGWPGSAAQPSTSDPADEDDETDRVA
jgi:hypothetical protein